METTRTLLPLNVVARRLRVPVRWLRAEAEAGRVPALRAGNQFLCDPAAVEAALLERARRPQPAPFAEGNGPSPGAAPTSRPRAGTRPSRPRSST
jgi:hypothetical protein